MKLGFENVHIFLDWFTYLSFWGASPLVSNWQWLHSVAAHHPHECVMQQQKFTPRKFYYVFPEMKHYVIAECKASAINQVWPREQTNIHGHFKHWSSWRSFFVLHRIQWEPFAFVTIMYMEKLYCSIEWNPIEMLYSRHPFFSWPYMA